MAYGTSSRLAWQHQTNGQGDPVRLTYALTFGSRGYGAHLIARTPDGNPVSDNQARDLMPKLHPLDVAIVRELRAGSVFGHLTDPQLARVLPLLAQRRCSLHDARLRITENTMWPRLRVGAGQSAPLALTMGLTDDEGTWHELSSGRLVAGPQAFFLQDNRAHPVDSAAPWELGSWARNPTLELVGELSPTRRDDIVRQLQKIGIPAEDLEKLAVRRGPPDAFTVHLTAETERNKTTAKLVLQADYGGTLVPILSQQPKSPYLLPESPNAGGLLERDLEQEYQARQVLRECGFRFDRQAEVYIAHGEAALAVLNPKTCQLPATWRIERSSSLPTFHDDISLHTKVQLQPNEGLLDFRFAFKLASQQQPNASESDSEEKSQALIAMKDLLLWLQSGQQYMRLKDGSFVAPGENFRRSLRILDDLGAQGDRALVSPLCVGLLRALGHAGELEVVDQATQGWLSELTGNEGPVPTDLPQALQAVLRDYQKRGVDWLAMLHRHRLTGILADDMGLGKTVQALTLLLHVREQEGAKPSLVIAPTSVVGVWRDEAQRFAPSLKLAVLHGPPKVRQEIDVQSADLVITSYGILRRDAERLSECDFRYVILDEAQSAKNAATENARAVRRLRSERRLALTGTPIENRPEELWAMFDFLAPGFLGSLRNFRKRYARPIERNDVEPQEILKARIYPFVLRRLKQEVATELPEKVESVMRCDMHPAQRALYEHLAGELRESVQNKIAAVGIERAHLDILAALTRLRQVCCDPGLLPGPQELQRPPSAKLELFSELMREALESERRVVVFSQFVEMQKRLLEAIRALGVSPLWLHGGTKDRDKVVANFQDPKGPPVIVVSLRAGGTGLTLTRADTVMHYDPWWNPAVERQATDRAHRLGQTQSVVVYKLICAQSIEERVLAMAADKEQLAKELLGSEGGSQQKRIKAEDVLALLG